MLGGQIYDTLPREQFSTHFVVCCVVTRSIVKPTDAIKLEFRQKSYEMQTFYCRLHLSGPVRWPTLSKDNVLDRKLFP